MAPFNNNAGEYIGYHGVDGCVYFQPATAPMNVPVSNMPSYQPEPDGGVVISTTEDNLKEASQYSPANAMMYSPTPYVHASVPVYVNAAAPQMSSPAPYAIPVHAAPLMSYNYSPPASFYSSTPAGGSTPTLSSRASTPASAVSSQCTAAGAGNESVSTRYVHTDHFVAAMLSRVKSRRSDSKYCGRINKLYYADTFRPKLNRDHV